jgi:hypothetical protein
MAKVLVEQQAGEAYVRYQCPGCRHDHCVSAKHWNWNGDIEKPTLSPSVRHYITYPEGTSRAGQEHTVCHYHIREGWIEYCNDCEHSLNGQRVLLPEIVKAGLSHKHDD